jgi:hypothetical protein
MVRVRDATAEELRRRAKAAGRTIAALVEEMLGPVPVSLVVEKPVKPKPAARVVEPEPIEPEPAPVPIRVATLMKASAVPLLPRCPKCQCSQAVHRAGEQGNRCEQHVMCRWTP